MKTARIVVLAIALSAGGVAAYLASGSDAPKQAAVEPVAQLPTVDVLVAKSDIALGQSVGPDDVQWQTWPSATASKRGSAATNGFFRRTASWFFCPVFSCRVPRTLALRAIHIDAIT